MTGFIIRNDVIMEWRSSSNVHLLGMCTCIWLFVVCYISLNCNSLWTSPTSKPWRDQRRHPKLLAWWGFMCRPQRSGARTTSPHHRYGVEINWRKRLGEIWKHASFGAILLLFPYSCTRFPFWKQQRLICSITVWRSSQWYWRYSLNELKVSLAGKCEPLVLQHDTQAFR